MESEELSFEYVVPNKPIYCSIQWFYFGRVIENLISNAAYFARQRVDSNKSFVRFEVKELSNNKVSISITDSGPGIPAGKEEAIFEVGETTKVDGYGIGLSIVKSAVASHGGKIEVKNEKNAGAKFSVIISKFVS